jgi:hypothetical protein
MLLQFVQAVVPFRLRLCKYEAICFPGRKANTLTQLSTTLSVRKDLYCPSTARHDVADWIVFPDDLIKKIGDIFLSIEDLDYYVVLRAVCCDWRHATPEHFHA